MRFIPYPTAESLGAEQTANKDQPNGYPGLDGDGNIVGPVVVRLETAADLSAIVLDDGELAKTTDTDKFYIGDGTTAGGLPVPIFSLSSVSLIKDDGTITFYSIAADTDAARGTALYNAVTAAAAGDVVMLGPGVFDVTAYGANGIAPAANITIVGVSMMDTKILHTDVDAFVLTVTGSNNLTLQSLRVEQSHALGFGGIQGGAGHTGVITLVDALCVVGDLSTCIYSGTAAADTVNLYGSTLSGGISHVSASSTCTLHIYGGSVLDMTKVDVTSIVHPNASQVLAAIKTVDGTGSGLDADKVDGVELAAILVKSGQVLNCFTALDNVPPASNYATPDTRNGHAVLDFDDTTAEAAIFQGVLPAAYNGGGLTVDIWSTATSAVTGNVAWNVYIERIGTALDIDADSFAAANTHAATTVSATSGIAVKSTVTFTDGADMDSLAAGEPYRLKIERDVATDTAVGDIELLRVLVRET
jgi:hypothetical protein